MVEPRRARSDAGTERRDRDGAVLVLDRITRRFPFLERIFVVADYQGPRVAAGAAHPVEVIRRTDTGFVVQPKRCVIERTFAWACINRRLARDVERAAETVRAGPPGVDASPIQPLEERVSRADA